MNKLENLLDRASRFSMTPEQREEQRRSFAYGNTGLENDHITRETVSSAAGELAEKAHEPCPSSAVV